ncbi:MAG: heme-binding domain-containing protein [Flavobacteriales bacterium]|nr:heme-binding domain-containing protein [Flavobacteriales bacterium]
MIKRILLALLAITLVAQFFQPDRSAPAIDPAKDMLAMTNAPADIQALVVGACYDCHSDRTDYPFWAYVTPINFIIQRHIDEGREELNYSRWDLFAGSEHAAKSGEEVAEGEMPPANYARMHGHAQLSGAQKDQLIAWLNATMGEAGHGEAGHDESDDDDDD